MKRKRILGSLIVVVVGYGVWTVGPRIRHAMALARHQTASAAREPRAVDEWRKAFGDPDVLLASLPDAAGDDVATRLTALARQGDIGVTGVACPACRAYVRSEVGKDGALVGAVPDDVRAYLEEHRAAIAAVAAFLTDHAPPIWPRDRDGAISIEALLPVPVLADILAADALAAYADELTAAAERALTASWQLHVSMRDRVEVVSQLLALSIADADVALVRRLTTDPVGWQTRLAGYDYRKSVARALLVESVRGLKQLPTDDTTIARAARADYLDTVRLLLIQLPSGPSTAVTPDARVGEPLSLGLAIAGPRSVGAHAAYAKADGLMRAIDTTIRALRTRAG